MKSILNDIDALFNRTLRNDEIKNVDMFTAMYRLENDGMKDFNSFTDQMFVVTSNSLPSEYNNSIRLHL